MPRPFRRPWLAATLAAATLAVPATGAGPRFFPDDPIQVDDDRALDASNAVPLEDTNGYDFLAHSFGHPGERRDVRALDVNTVDEVPDSSWFTNRIGRAPLSVADVVRGPDRQHDVDVAGWLVSGGKSSGVQPGFRMTGTDGQVYQIEIDPPAHPEMASAAEVIGTAFYHAIGYSVVEVHLAEIDRAALRMSDTATIRDPLNGRRRPMDQHDLDVVFARAARQSDGRYRVLVSRFAAGRPLGNFRYSGTRPDDPNDIVPHEHRRSLRAARVFGAWLNHDDSRGVNSLDMLETGNGHSWIRHYMFDFGSILGSGTVFAQTPRAGNEYIFEARPGWLTLVTLGLYVRPWMRIDYPEVPASVGRFESAAFDPRAWRPEYPNPAFDNMRPDDAFWAARIVGRFTDAMVRGVVEKARYSDPAATDYVTRTLIARRDKVVRAFLNGVCPVVDPTLGPDGVLRFANAAVDAGAATPAHAYTLRWFTLDNATGIRTAEGAEVRVTELQAPAPEGLLARGDFVGVRITGLHPQHPRWASPASFTFRRNRTGWQLVGVER
ncbi:hypothetical protein TBR22_A18480 [Luteitalea sp. TBR-22]|uniref:hypothetical protein n=1 Tax=Luteitalea sp. TBR-22 TaxID=2802971 RepID=UPI001AF99413|nr:hypothetical protein [Luteitalea sp. TBR-22]BCS32634.1 hypothetical protein TBR22_A18480 [Luteitalea sp. TBR-22]